MAILFLNFTFVAFDQKLIAAPTFSGSIHSSFFLLWPFAPSDLQVPLDQAFDTTESAFLDVPRMLANHHPAS